jgi:xanthine dehydrogenase molybdenum-binding subunit
MAASKIRDVLIREGSSILKTNPESLATQKGRVYIKENPGISVSFAEISSNRHFTEGGPLSLTVNYLPEMDPIDSSRAKGLTFSAFKGVTLCCHAAIVQVNQETGQIEIKKYVAAHDVGKAINPRAIEGQIEGGVSMGLGFALTEKCNIDKKGDVLNPDFSDYKLLTSLDIPDTEPVIVEIPSVYGPFGAKGVGEPPASPPAAVVGNAIYDAIGIRMLSTPMIPEDICKEIMKKKRNR